MKRNLLLLFCVFAFINKIHSQTTWELLNPTPTVNNGKDIDFFTNNIGYIITSEEIIETLDAGNTWLKKQNISSGNDMDLFNTTGYIVGNNGYVLKSTDNGATWNQISTGFFVSFNTVTIIDENNIILSSSNSIVKTNNGGTTWQSLSMSIPNISVNKTFFTSSLIGHAVCDQGEILKTINGGQSWYSTQSTTIGPSDYFTVYFINESIGFASREHSDLYKTIDGGETWTEVSVSSQAIYDFHFIDENNGFATGDAGATYKTTDGGNTWNLIPFQSGYVLGTSMYGIYFQDSSIGYITGASGRIIKTTDGGNTWTFNSPTYNDIKQLDFLTDTIGYGLVGNSLFKTTDEGITWTNIGAPVADEKTAKFDFINENIGFALVGGEIGTSANTGSVYKTIDGGFSWTKMNTGLGIINEDLYSIDFINENVGFISGGYNLRQVLKTIDGGINWTPVLNKSFNQIQFVSDLVGYGNRIGNSNAAIYKTIDGGNTWTISIELVGEQIRAFKFVDENNGYFVGNNALAYKTSNGGINWEELEIPYQEYISINFYTKNVGYIADDNGSLYKTVNGGATWSYLTRQYRIFAIEFNGDKIYTAGSTGKIYRSDVVYPSLVLSINPAINISSSGARLTGNVTSNGEAVSDIRFEYSTDFLFNNIISTTPNTVESNESENVSIDLLNLAQNTTYYYRLAGTQNSNIGFSLSQSFTTASAYQITTNSIYQFSSTYALVSGYIVSNGNDITNIEFEYGTSTNALDNSISGNPTSVAGYTSGNISGNLINLLPETQYYCRIKATHEGEIIYGNIQSFTTFPEYYITLYSPSINGNNVSLSAYLTSYNQNITNIVFEYGTTIEYGNSSVTTPSQVSANNSAYVNTTITNLDSNLNYFYRLKAIHNGTAIYSEEGVFNFSGNIIIVGGTTEETPTNSLKLVGLINSNGTYVSNIHFEYGTSTNFGSTIVGSPNYVFDYTSKVITALINNPLPNQTYYYRLVATYNGNTIYSDTYEYTTGLLNVSNFDIKNKIVIYPNPANDLVNIKTNFSEKVVSIEFYDVLGKIIFVEKIKNLSDIKIDVSNFEKGIYFLKVNFEDNKTFSSKLILN